MPASPIAPPEPIPAEPRVSFAIRSPTAEPVPNSWKVRNEYSIYINSTKKHIMIVQFPTRDRHQPFNAKNGQMPTTMRIKPISGIVEIDIPVIVSLKSFDQEKVETYEDAFRSSKLLQSGGSYGMAGGLGAQHVAAKSAAQSSTANILKAESIIGGQSMDKITYWGKIERRESWKPRYYIGTFEDTNCSKGNLYLTRVDAIVMMTPKLDFRDALTDRDRPPVKSQRKTDEPAKESEARDVNMAVKSTEDDEVELSEIAKELKQIEEEPWQHLEWRDEDDFEAWAMHDKELFLPKELRSTKLVAELTPRQYLDSISAPRVDPIARKPRRMTSHTADADLDSDSDETGSEDTEKELENDLHDELETTRDDHSEELEEEAGVKKRGQAEIEENNDEKECTGEDISAIDVG